jgi:lysophospholipase L1-like esterase
VDGLTTSLAEKAQQTDLDTTNANVTLKADKTYVDNKIGSIGNTKTFKGSITFASLPTSGNTGGDYYYVTDKATNYCWNGTTWIDIGNSLNIGVGSIKRHQTNYLQSVGVNIINPENITPTWINPTTGATNYPDGSSSSTDFFPVNVGDVIYKNYTANIIFYDSTKTFVSSSGTSGVAVPSGVAYIRICAVTTNFPGLMVTINNLLPGSYTPYQVTDPNLLIKNSNLHSSFKVNNALLSSDFNALATVAAGSVQRSKLNYYTSAGVNVLNLETVVSMYINPSTGAITSPDAISSASDFIPVNVGDTVTRNNTANIIFYDSNKNFVSGTGSSPVTVPIGVSYIRIGAQTTLFPTMMVTINNGMPSSYVPYQVNDPNLLIKNSNLHPSFTVPGYVDPSSSAYLQKTLKTVYSEDFKTTKSDWLYDNCTPSNGITLSGNAKAYWNKYLTFDTWYHKAIVKLNDITSVFGLVNNNNTKGAIFLVDGTAKTINIYGLYTGTYTLPAIKASTALSFSLVTGKDYILEVFKTGKQYTFSITDPQSLSKTTATYDNTLVPIPTDYAGNGWGGTGVVTISGSIFVKSHSLSIGNFGKTRILFIGDSITEADSLMSDMKNRWCSQLRDVTYNGNAIIMGRSGSNTTDLIPRLQVAYDIGIKPDIVVVLIGTNNRTVGLEATWETDIVTIHDLIASNGSVPVIAVPPIPQTDSSYILQMRDFILNKGWNTIRFDYATTLNRDGTSYNSAMYTDGTHPNVTGANAMYQQAVVDLGLM